MAFVNEKISHDDRQMYGLDKLDERKMYGKTISRQWTIDRDKDVFLRHTASGREEHSNSTWWEFYWRGSHLLVELELVDGTGERGGHIETTHRLRKLDLSPSLKQFQEQIVLDLQDALQAYKDGGVLATAASFKHTLLV